MKDNDIIHDCFDQKKYESDLRNTLIANKKILKIKNIDNISVWFHGIPTNNFSFDHFLLFHFVSKIYLKNKNNPIKFLEIKINKNYKGDYKSIEKIFNINNNWKNNLFSNSKNDANYIKLVETLFKK